MDWPSQPSLQIYPLDRYSFVNDPALSTQSSFKGAEEEDWSALQAEYREYGMRRSLQLVLIAHAHGHAHLLLFQEAGGRISLPGAPLQPQEGEAEALQRILHHNLRLPEEMSYRWQADECLACWWRPAYDQRMYPYCPVHVSQPREQIRVMLVRMPVGAEFRMPMGRRLLAVPLCDLRAEGAEGRFGPLIASLPHLLSRYHFITLAQ